MSEKTNNCLYGRASGAILGFRRSYVAASAANSISDRKESKGRNTLSSARGVWRDVPESERTAINDCRNTQFSSITRARVRDCIENVSRSEYYAEVPTDVRRSDGPTDRGPHTRAVIGMYRERGSGPQKALPRTCTYGARIQYTVRDGTYPGTRRRTALEVKTRYAFSVGDASTTRTRTEIQRTWYGAQ